MASPEQDRTAADIRNRERIRRQMYESARPAIEDHLKWLSMQETDALRVAGLEMDNATRKSLYLQASLTYGKVKAHLAEMLGGVNN